MMAVDWHEKVRRVIDSAEDEKYLDVIDDVVAGDLSAVAIRTRHRDPDLIVSALSHVTRTATAASIEWRPALLPPGRRLAAPAGDNRRTMTDARKVSGGGGRRRPMLRHGVYRLGADAAVSRRTGGLQRAPRRRCQG